MGDIGPTKQRKREVHVLVSGAGLFHQHTKNPANLIVSALPAHLEPLRNRPDEEPEFDIKLYPTPAPWQVSYSWVKENIPPMLFPPDTKIPDSQTDSLDSKSRPNYDVVLFVGMSGSRTYYSFETQGHRDGYRLPDVDKKTPEDKDHWARLGCPETLATSFDPEKLHHDWQDNVPKDIDVQISNDAGRYLCDYIYYTGLSSYWLHDGKTSAGNRPVMFLHVPKETDENSIQRGVLAAAGLIRALAHQWRARSE